MRWADRLIARVTRRPPDFVIGGTERPYLRRWWLTPWRGWTERAKNSPRRAVRILGRLAELLPNAYLHQFLRSDDDRALHDHPFYNASLLLLGRYLEHTPSGVFERKAGDLVLRRGVSLHRIELHDGACWSLFVVGPRYRTWGFACPNGWRPWREFVDARDKGAIGRGCD